MALFVFPIDAVRAARDMVWKLNEYNGSKHKRTHIGVGIHTGVSILGIVGDDDRANVTVLSDAVNLAARIESLTKKYGTPILISGNTASDERIHNHFSPQYLGDVKVKGKNRVTSIYSVMTADLASA